MATPILNIPTVAASQTQKEVTINDAIAALEAAGNDVVAVEVDSTNALTISDAQWRGYGTLSIVADGTSPPTATITVTVPAIKRHAVVINTTGQAVSAAISGQTEDAVVIADGSAVSVVSDGTDLRASGGGTSGGSGPSSFLGLTDTPASFSGQSGKAVVVNTGESALEFVDLPAGSSGGAGGGAYEFIEAIEITSATAKMDVAFPAGYASIMIVLAAAPDTDNPHLLAQFTDDDFATVEATNYFWIDVRANDGTGGVYKDEGASDTSIRLATSIGNAPGEDYQGYIELPMPRDSARETTLMSRMARANGNPNYNMGFAHARHAVQSAISGMRLSFSGGNIASAKAYVYGLRDSAVVTVGEGAASPLATYDLADKTSSTDVTVDIALPSGHDALVIEGYFTPTADAWFDFFFSTDGGSSWLNGASDYGHATWTFSATGGTAWENARAVIQGFDAKPNGGERQYIRLELRDYDDASLKTTLRWKSWGLLGSGSPTFTEGFAVANTAAAHDAFRIKGYSTDLDELSLSVWDCATVDGVVGGAGSATGTASAARAVWNPTAVDKSFAADTLHTLDWDVAAFDTGGYWDVSSPSRLTIPAGVSHVVVDAIVFQGGGSMDYNLYIYKNGAEFCRAAATTQWTGPNELTTGVIEVAEGDYFEVVAKWSSSGEILAAQVEGCGFSIYAVPALVNPDPVLPITDDTNTARTLALDDAGAYVRMDNGAANTVTVPPDSSVAFAVGTQITVRQAGAGQTTIAAGTGVTINTPETLKLKGQHASATLIKVATDEWDLTGDLEAAP
jgi:hypothetical protein